MSTWLVKFSVIQILIWDGDLECDYLQNITVPIGIQSKLEEMDECWEHLLNVLLIFLNLDSLSN